VSDWESVKTRLEEKRRRGEEFHAESIDVQVSDIRAALEEIERLRVHEDASAQFLAERDELRVELEKLHQRVEELERAVALLDQAATDYRKSRDAAEVRLTEWEAGAHADETGHLHLCAKVNGGWHCKPGCAKAEVARLRAEAMKAPVDPSGYCHICDTFASDLRRIAAAEGGKAEAFAERLLSVAPAQPEPFSDAACGPRYAEPKEGKR
jgi:DNA repair exonuclease SbcCD ATPase subunit